MRTQGMMKMAAAGLMAVTMMAAPGRILAQGSDVVLKTDDVKKLLPDHVYYKGQSAPTQVRNSGGVKLADGYYVLATLVDNSGYATDLAAKYQAYFITEVPIKVGGQSLAAGVYGAGFIANDKFVLTDVGGHEVLTVDAGADVELKRPMPLQVVADPAGGFRLYAGRKYVVLTR